MTGSFTRRCTPSRVTLYVWFVIWEDEQGAVREDTFETTQVGFDGIYARIGQPKADKYSFEFIGSR